MFNKLLSIFTGSILFLNSAVFAEIIETNEISKVEKYITKDTLVLLNVTSTLYKPANTLSDNQWRNYFAEKVYEIVKEKTLADSFINKIKHEIVTKIPKDLVEENTRDLVAELQNQKIPVFGITQKSMSTPYADNFGLITHKHLVNLGINLENSLTYTDIKNGKDESYSFAYGLIFTKKKAIGPAVVDFINHIQNKPASVIIVDNSIDCLKNAEIELEKANISFIGFRYGRCDSIKENFDPILGTIQFFAFINENRIMSDDEAKQIKQSNPDVDYTSILEKYISENSCL